MKILDIIMESLPRNDADEIVGKGGKFKGKHPFIGDQVAVFHGPNSKSWDPEMIRLAAKLEKLGQNREKIWAATGVFRNSNGDWRMEISDYNMKVKGIPEHGKAMKLGDVINHPELFKAYPLLKNMPIHSYKQGQDPNNVNALGYYLPSTKSIGIQLPVDDSSTQVGQDFMQWKRTLVHEIQHAIQNIEKPRSMKSGNSDHEIKKALKRAGIDQSDYQVYAAWWKEVDARMADSRLEVDPDTAKYFVPTSWDTDYVQVDLKPNLPPGEIVAKHPALYPEIKEPDMVSIKNPYMGVDDQHRYPYKLSPTYNHGNMQGSVDVSADGHKQLVSPYRNKPTGTGAPASSPRPKPRPNTK